MSEGPVVADASPVIALEQIGLIGVLAGLYGEVWIPPAVAGEVAPSVVLPPHISVRVLARAPEASVVAARMGPGETDALSLALEAGARLFLVDDRKARREAERLGISVVSTPVVLVSAKQHGLVPTIRGYLDGLVNQHHLWLSPQIVDAVLRRAGEA